MRDPRLLRFFDRLLIERRRADEQPGAERHKDQRYRHEQREAEEPTEDEFESFDRFRDDRVNGLPFHIVRDTERGNDRAGEEQQ